MNIEIIIAVTIAVAGWIATHWLTIRAQNKAFINQIMNEARIEITKAIRDYQDWLGTVLTAIYGVSSDIVLQEQGAYLDQLTQQKVDPLQRNLQRAANWLQKNRQLTQLFFNGRSPGEWIFRLEEYGVLFPKTAECRGNLAQRQCQITEFLQSFLKELPSGFEKPSELKQREKAIEKAQENAGIILDQQILMEDLQIYLQNLCLGSFTGNKIPERKPAKSCPVLIQDKKGNLRIIANQSSAKSSGD